MMNRPHGRMILAFIEKGPLVWPSIIVDGVTRLKEYTELTPAEAIQADGGGTPRCSQAKGLKVEERLVQLRMEVRFEVLIERKKMYYLGLRRFDLWMEFLMVHLEELGLRK
ncbi:hypothetical protein Tco_1228142 [Tanacetum coccineum]